MPCNIGKRWTAKKFIIVIFPLFLRGLFGCLRTNKAVMASETPAPLDKESAGGVWLIST